MMFGKMILAVAAAVVLPLSAAAVFELKFDGNKPNWKGYNNNENLVKIEHRAFAGAKMATVFTNKNPKAIKGDTSFGAWTTNFKVTGKKTIKISGEVYSSINLKDTSGNWTRNSVVALLPGGKMKLFPFTVSTPKKEFTKFAVTIPVTKEMNEVYVQLGYDNPNMYDNNVMAIKALKVEVE